MNEKERIAAGREHLLEAANEAPDAVIDKLIQSINLGSTVLGMFDALCKTREAMPKIIEAHGGDEDSEVSFGSRCLMANQVTGDSIMISVSIATAEDIEEYKREIEEAAPFPE